MNKNLFPVLFVFLLLSCCSCFWLVVFFESLLKVAVFSLQNFWVLFVFAVFFYLLTDFVPQKDRAEWFC